MYYKLIIQKKISVAGITNSKLSILSKIPPCPGKILPLSLTFKERLINDSHKSPNVENTDTIIAKLIHAVNSGPSKKELHHILKHIAEITESIRPPQNPSHDFLGEIRSYNLCLPNKVPTQYAPVSLIHINIKIARSI